MCEIIGISLKSPSKPIAQIEKFLKGGIRYHSGWGIAFYPDDTAQIVKEAGEANQNSFYIFLKFFRELKSNIFLGQLRNCTTGSTSRKDAHPFCRELNGKEYVFVHNGTLFGFKNLQIERFIPIGDTDSEYIFCHLLGCISERNITKWEPNDFEWLAEKLRELNKLGTLNCIFSDGEHLFCYKSTKRENNLYFNPIKSNSNEFKTLDYWCHNWKNSSKIGMLISTRKLTNNRSYELKIGELIVLKKGKVVYSNFMKT